MAIKADIHDGVAKKHKELKVRCRAWRPSGGGGRVRV